MNRLVFDTHAMLRTAATLDRRAAELGLLAARLAPDAATVMPPDLAADVAGTVARTGGALGSVAARYGAEGLGLTARAAAAQVADDPIRALYEGDSLLLDFLLASGDPRFLSRSRLFPRGAFNPWKWLLGGRRWGYRNGLKSVLRGDLETLRGMARLSGRAWRSLGGDVSRGTRAVLTSFGRDVKVIGRAVLRRGAGLTVRFVGRLALKAAVPFNFYLAYRDSHARTVAGRATSAFLSTVVDLVPAVAVADAASGNGVGGAMDADVIAVEGAVTGYDGVGEAYDLASSGRYGYAWELYADLVTGT